MAKAKTTATKLNVGYSAGRVYRVVNGKELTIFEQPVQNVSKQVCVRNKAGDLLGYVVKFKEKHLGIRYFFVNETTQGYRTAAINIPGLFPGLLKKEQTELVKQLA